MSHTHQEEFKQQGKLNSRIIILAKKNSDHDLCRCWSESTYFMTISCPFAGFCSFILIQALGALHSKWRRHMHMEQGNKKCVIQASHAYLSLAPRLRCQLMPVCNEAPCAVKATCTCHGVSLQVAQRIMPYPQTGPQEQDLSAAPSQSGLRSFLIRVRLSSDLR